MILELYSIYLYIHIVLELSMLLIDRVVRPRNWRNTVQLTVSPAYVCVCAV